MNDFLWQEWNLTPPVLCALGMIVFAFVRGTRIQERATGAPIRRASVIAFVGACLTLVIAFVSPLNALADNLFSAHALQHMLVVLVAAPLFVLSGSFSAIGFALPSQLRTSLAIGWQRTNSFCRLCQWVARAPVAWIIFASVLWLWHLPLFYQLSVANELIHSLEHGMFLAAALLFWWTLLHPVRKMDYGTSVLAAFTTALQSGALGAVLAFSAQPWYSLYTATARRFGFAPLVDQQLAGLLIWIPSGLVFVLTAGILFVVWLNTVEHDMREQQRLVLGQPDSAFRK